MREWFLGVKQRLNAWDFTTSLPATRLFNTFGDTPGKVRARAGRHFQYRDTGFDFRKLSSLKAFGIIIRLSFYLLPGQCLSA